MLVRSQPCGRCRLNHRVGTMYWVNFGQDQIMMGCDNLACRDGIPPEILGDFISFPDRYISQWLAKLPWESHYPKIMRFVILGKKDAK